MKPEEKKNASKKNLYIVALISFLNAVTLSSIIPIIYNYANSFGLNDTEIGFLFASFAFAQFFATPVIGRLSDKYGRKPLLAISLFGTFIASLIQAFAVNSLMLFFGRIFDGITGGNNSVAQAVIADSTSPKDRPFGFAIFGASFGFGFFLGPVISLFLSNYGNNIVFVFSAFLAFIATLITIFALPETNQSRETKQLKIFDTLFLQIFRAMKIPVVSNVLILNFIVSLSAAIFQIAFQPYIKINFGYGQEYISYVLILSGMISILFIKLVDIVTKRYGLNKTLNNVFLFRLLCFALLAFVVHPFAFWLSVIILGFVNLFARPVISGLLSNYSRPEDQGVVFGVNESLFSLGLAIGPSIFAILAIPNNQNFSFFGVDSITNILYSTASNYTLSFLAITLISLVAWIHSLKFTNHLKHINKKELDIIDF